MKILYDHQIFSSQVFGGISRYFSELMSSFSRESQVDFELALRYSDNSYLHASEFCHCRSFFGGKRFFGRTTLINLLNGSESRRALSLGGYDLFHPTYYNPYYLDLAASKPVVVTVYDMTHELYPEMFSKRDQTVAWKKAVLEKASAIIAISESTKKDLLKYCPVDERKVKVVHLASSLPCNRETAAPADLPGDYLLFVGQRSGYKNFAFFIRALSPLMQSRPELAIVCAGGGAFTPQELGFLAEAGISGRVKHYPASDEFLALLYKKARAFVFPSLYEGFGIPLLEAFAAGCPVIASNRSSLSEIAGDAAVLIDPEDENSLTGDVVKVLDDEQFRSSLVERGMLRAADFSWDKTASSTRIIYESLI